MIAITTVTPTVFRCLSLVKVPRQERRSLHFLTSSKVHRQLNLTGWGNQAPCVGLLKCGTSP